MDRNFHANAPNVLWVADITYVPTWSGFLYLAVVLDAFSRKIIGWAMGNSQKAQLVIDAMNMAVTQRKPASVVHHSDQGSQHTSVAFGLRCKEMNVRPSMGSVGDCYDIASPLEANQWRLQWLTARASSPYSNANCSTGASSRQRQKLWAVLNGSLFVLYIVLGHKISEGGTSGGVERLGAAMMAAFLFVMPVGFLQALEAFGTPLLVLAGIGVGICSSVTPYVSDQLAMLRLPRSSFAFS